MTPHGKIFTLLISLDLVVYIQYGTALLKFKLFVESFSLDHWWFFCTSMFAQIKSVQEQSFTVEFVPAFAKVDWALFKVHATFNFFMSIILFYGSWLGLILMLSRQQLFYCMEKVIIFLFWYGWKIMVNCRLF